MTNPPILLRACGLQKSFGSTPVLRSIDLELRAAERVALIGPSGSGKSTLLHCLGGLEPFDGGTLTFAQQDVRELSPEALACIRRTEISSVFQFFHLLPTLTAEENIAFPLQLLGVPHDERLERVETLLHEVQLDHRRNALPSKLSGGEQQRVALARALVIRPKLILADEPTGNLDRTTGASILDLLQSLTQSHQIALVLVTHSLDATRICQRTFELRDGNLAPFDTSGTTGNLP